jgi:hypothetical protein
MPSTSRCSSLRSDVVRSYARHKNLPLVALLDDEMVVVDSLTRAGTGSAWRDSLTSEDAWEISATEDGVLRLRALSEQPASGASAGAARLASRWIRQVVARGYLETQRCAGSRASAQAERTRTSGISARVQFALPGPDAVPLVAAAPEKLSGIRWKLSLRGKVELPLHRLSPKQIQELERVQCTSLMGMFPCFASDGEQEFTVDSNAPVASGFAPRLLPERSAPRRSVLVCEMEARGRGSVPAVRRGRLGSVSTMQRDLRLFLA